MALQVNDKIEVRINTAWKPAVIKHLYADGDIAFLTAEFLDDSQLNIMVLNEYTVWRYPDAPVVSS
ncbi:hypothetical protein LCGC14_0373840 [marine sediment metagenome]|uniref:Uncharacterized protein n=1 Tax=marine sediment metagenome TaxID=412755 RepID=A0A0F9WD60_9ZZZZ